MSVREIKFWKASVTYLRGRGRGMKVEGRKGERKGWAQLRERRGDVSRAALAAAAPLFDFVLRVRPWAHGAEH